MEGKSRLQLAAGIVLIFLGILFVIGFGVDPQDLITDTIFIVFGAILIRSAYSASKKEPISNFRQGRNKSREKRKNSS